MRWELGVETILLSHSWSAPHEPAPRPRRKDVFREDLLSGPERGRHSLGMVAFIFSPCFLSGVYFIKSLQV